MDKQFQHTSHYSVITHPCSIEVNLSKEKGPLLNVWQIYLYRSWHIINLNTLEKSIV